MIPASGAGGRGFDSPNSPEFFFYGGCTASDLCLRTLHPPLPRLLLLPLHKAHNIPARYADLALQHNSRAHCRRVPHRSRRIVCGSMQNCWLLKGPT